jgi:pimeloyl-ACP methyl ester carboxylesterase
MHMIQTTERKLYEIREGACMSSIHLIHGAWHGRWCWEKLIPGLQAAGHTVVANDLPGLGSDRTPAVEITLERYTDAVCDALAKEPSPAVVVGHSMAGVVIGEAAERMPEKIKALVYLTAYLLLPGQSLIDAAMSDPEASQLGQHLLMDGPCCTIRPDKIPEFLYGCCPREDAILAAALLVPQPLVAFTTPARVTAGRFGRIPKFYIQCLQDRTVPPSLQRTMIAATPCERIFSLNTDHSPFLSAPDELAAQILEISS